MDSQGTGWSYHLHLSTGSLQIGQRGLSIGGASCQDGLWLVGGQGVGRGPRNDGLWLAGDHGVVTYKWTTGRGQIANVKLKKGDDLKLAYSLEVIIKK